MSDHAKDRSRNWSEATVGGKGRGVNLLADEQNVDGAEVEIVEIRHS